MSRHLVTLHARDRAGSAVSGVRWQFYPYTSDPAWLSFSGGVYSVDSATLPAARTIYSSPNEQVATEVTDLSSGTDGTPAEHAYLPAGRYIALGSIGTGAGTRYWVVKDYILGVREVTSAIDAQGETFNSAAYIALVDAAFAEITNPYIGKRVEVRNYLDAEGVAVQSSTYVYRDVPSAGGETWVRDAESVQLAATYDPADTSQAVSGAILASALTNVQQRVERVTALPSGNQAAEAGIYEYILTEPWEVPGEGVVLPRGLYSYLGDGTVQGPPVARTNDMSIVTLSVVAASTLDLELTTTDGAAYEIDPDGTGFVSQASGPNVSHSYASPYSGPVRLRFASGSAPRIVKSNANTTTWGGGSRQVRALNQRLTVEDLRMGFATPIDVQGVLVAGNVFGVLQLTPALWQTRRGLRAYGRHVTDLKLFPAARLIVSAEEMAETFAPSTIRTISITPDDKEAFVTGSYHDAFASFDGLTLLSVFSRDNRGALNCDVPLLISRLSAVTQIRIPCTSGTVTCATVPSFRANMQRFVLYAGTITDDDVARLLEGLAATTWTGPKQIILTLPAALNAAAITHRDALIAAGVSVTIST